MPVQTFIDQPGSQVFAGSPGIDQVIYPFTKSQVWALFDNQSFYQVDAITGSTDYLSSIERLRLNDISVAVDVFGNAGQAFRLYTAAFGRLPDLRGLGYWINELDNGSSLQQVARSFVASQEFQSLYGSNPDYAYVIGEFYKNILGRVGEPAGVAYWVNEIITGKSIAEILIGFSESFENKFNTSVFTNSGIEYLSFDQPFASGVVPPLQPFPLQGESVPPGSPSGGSFSGNLFNGVFDPSGGCEGGSCVNIIL